MANSAGFSVVAKVAALAAIVGSGTYKCALYLSSASIDNTTAAYTATGEVSGTNYSAGGVSAGSFSSASSSGGTTAYSTPTASITFSTVTLSTAFNCALIYDTTQTNRSLGVFTFGDQTVTAADFVLQMPTNNGTAGLLRIA
jgi:hypothetical protein